MQKTDVIGRLSEYEIKKEIEAGNYNLNYEEIINSAIESTNEDTVKLKNIANENLDSMMIEFYTLIAMTCLYGGMLSIASINQTLANMSNKGKRVAVSPTKKGSIVFSSLLASFLVQLIGVAILFAYTIFVLKIDYGDNIGLVALLAVIGSFAGLSMGIAVGSLLIFSLLLIACSFFSLRR